jgi:hypothetical protein
MKTKRIRNYNQHKIRAKSRIKGRVLANMWISEKCDDCLRLWGMMEFFLVG